MMNQWFFVVFFFHILERNSDVSHVIPELVKICGDYDLGPKNQWVVAFWFGFSPTQWCDELCSLVSVGCCPKMPKSDEITLLVGC
jgi:hypothetical protein